MNELIAQLTAPFAVNEHEFHRGYVYLSEEAISRRLDTTAPDWTWELFTPDIRVTDTGVYIAQRGRLTVAGVFRDGVGMAAPVLNKSGSEANEPEKSAATDAFKRAARMFGIGRYLLSTPEWVKDHTALQKWLSGAQPQQQRPAPQQPAQPGNELQAWITSNPTESQQAYGKGKAVFMAAALNLLYNGNPHHMKNSIAKHEGSGLLKADMSVADALTALAQLKAAAAA